MVYGELVAVVGYTNAVPRCKCRLGVLFVGCNTVQSGNLLTTFWKLQVPSERVN
jgi:hypothetical protein